MVQKRISTGDSGTVIACTRAVPSSSSSPSSSPSPSASSAASSAPSSAPSSPSRLALGEARAPPAWDSTLGFVSSSALLRSRVTLSVGGVGRLRELTGRVLERSKGGKGDIKLKSVGEGRGRGSIKLTRRPPRRMRRGLLAPAAVPPALAPLAACIMPNSRAVSAACAASARAR